MKRSLLALAALAAIAIPLSAFAHKQWMVPSATVVAGKDVWVTVDGAVSNDLFFPDHMPMRLDSIVVTAPDGSQSKPQNGATGKYRSVFDVELTQQGTYRIANVNAGLTARWDTAESLAAAANAPKKQGEGPGNNGPRGGFLRNATPEDFAKVGRLISEGKLTADMMLTHRYAFATLAEIYERDVINNRELIKGVITF